MFNESIDPDKSWTHVEGLIHLLATQVNSKLQTVDAGNYRPIENI